MFKTAALVAFAARTTSTPAPHTPRAKAPALTAQHENAVSSAQNYLSFQGFSRQGLIDQLDSAHGDQFTPAQATYGAQHAGAAG